MSQQTNQQLASIGVWSAVTTNVRELSESGRELWSWIQRQIDLALYKPQPTTGVLSSRLSGREGVYYVLRTPDASSYLKLTEEDFYLWRQMDGQKTVKDLVVAYFVQFGGFAVGRVGQLVRELRRGGFLVDRPVDVMAHAQAELEGRELAGRGERLLAAFLNQEIRFSGVDDWLTRLYRYTSWLFAWPVQILLLSVIVAGLIFFVQTLVAGQVPLLTVGSSYWLGLIALFAIHAVIIFLHELSHGLATKHFGRQVRGGGFMVYYGYPAFFVDTMDMWLEGRWARIAVSWAGPHSGLVVGGLGALLVQILPASAATPWLFKLAFVAYLNVFLNLNPLLELDGYFILIDLLDIPMLRQRAFSFVRGQLGGELREMWRGWRQGLPDWRASFTQEERLLAVFGLLAAAYTLYTLWVALFFWQTQVLTALRELWSRPGWASKLLLLLILGLVIVPLSAALLAQLLAWVRGGLAWLERRGFFERMRNLVLTLVALFLLATLGPVALYDPWWSHYLAWMPLLLYALALLALGGILRRYRGAEFRRVFWAWAATLGLLGLAALLRVVGHLRSGDLGAQPDAIVSWSYQLGRLSTLPLVLAGFFGLRGVDLGRGRAWERVVMAALIAVAGLVAMPVARWTADLSLGSALLSVTAPYLTLLFVALVIPNLAAFGRTRFAPAWLALVAAAVLTGLLGAVRAAPNAPAPDSDLDRWLALLTAGLWGLGAVLYDLAGQRMRFERAEWAEAHVISDEKRLRQAFVRFFAGLFGSFEENFGARRARAVDDALDVLSVTADWDVEIDSGRVVDELDLSRMTLWEQADRYREVLARTVDLIDDWAGSQFVSRAAQAAYDSLPWPEREVLGYYVLAGTDWGAAIARQFAAHQGVRRRLVRAVPLFAHCNERALNLIIGSLELQSVPAGTLIARQGRPVDRFVLIQSGEVEVWQRDQSTGLSQLIGELRRGGNLGHEAFFGVGHYDATYRASVPSELLVLDVATCDRLLRSGVALATRVGVSLQAVRLLSGMPLFEHLSPQQLSALAGRMRRRTVWGRQVVAHQGAERHSLFIVLEGEIEALSRDAEGNMIVSHVYTPGEHFGEYALFADTPYQFTYRTRGPAKLLTLDEGTFDALVAQSTRMAGYVEQVGSGRLLTVQHSSDK